MSIPTTTSTPVTSSATERPSFEELLGILQHNQGLIEFADSKAGSLILLNSLLIAAVSALPISGELGMFKLGSLLITSAAIFVCFQVISSKANATQDASAALVEKKNQKNSWETNDFIFFGCVTSYKSGEEYCRAYGQSNPDSRRRAVLNRTYILAGIAQRKFSQYAIAQKLTAIAMVVWLAVNVLPFIKLQNFIPH